MYKDAISHFNNPKPGGWEGENVDFLYKINFNRFINLDMCSYNGNHNKNIYGIHTEINEKGLKFTKRKTNQWNQKGKQ